MIENATSATHHAGRRHGGSEDRLRLGQLRPQTTTYTLTATGPNGTTNATVTVQVGASRGRATRRSSGSKPTR